MPSLLLIACSSPLVHLFGHSPGRPAHQRARRAKVTAKRGRRDAAREVARTAVREGRGGSAARAAAAADFSDEAALAPVLDNSLGWAAFMGTSANVRYQLVNAIEERFLVRAPAPCACRLRCGRVCLLRWDALLGPRPRRPQALRAPCMQCVYASICYSLRSTQLLVCPALVEVPTLMYLYWYALFPADLSSTCRSGRCLAAPPSWQRPACCASATRTWAAPCGWHGRAWPACSRSPQVWGAGRMR
jgi:hypothetical protein